MQTGGICTVFARHKQQALQQHRLGLLWPATPGACFRLNQVLLADR